MADKVDKITIIDRTAYNTPAKWGNTGQALVFHFLGVVGDNPDLYSSNGSGRHYGGQWYISRKGEIYHSVKEGGTVWAVGSGGWGLKTTKWNNSNTESVEMGVECDGDKNSIYDKKWWFHMVTQNAAVKLARYWLEHKGYGVSEKTVNERILVHNSITNKPCPAPWLHGAGYKTSREAGQVNWSFEEFKKKIWQGYTGRTEAVFSGGSGGQSSSGSSSSTLRKGSTGDAVKTMQTMLLALNYDLGGYGADGDFGSATESALKAFQKDHSLEVGGMVDGIYGSKSKAALEAAYKNLAATIKRGDKGDAVKKMQEMLIACKCLDEGEADGDFGPKTEGAVKMAQYILLGDGKQTGIYDATTKSAVEKCYAKVTDKRFIFKDTNFAFVFDPKFYLDKYEDLKKAYGTDEQKAFDHFVKHGMNEKRQGSADFNVEVYAKNYPELVEHYKGDWFMLYRHYALYGLWESRRGI